MMDLVRTMAIGLAATMLAGAASAAEIAYPVPRIFAESITATAKGDLITGSGDGTLWRARPGDQQVSRWRDATQTGGGALFGVYADDASNTLWACAFAAPENGKRAAVLRSFDLTTGALRASYPLGSPGPGLCNDIAVARDGTVYVTETIKGVLYRLGKGDGAPIAWFTDPRIAGLDGVAIDDDGTLYLMTVSTPHAFRLMRGADGKPGTLTELTLSRPMDHADGLRAIGHGRFLVSENGPQGGVAIATVKGDTVDLAMVSGSRPGTTSAVLVGNQAWAVIPKLDYLFSPALAGKDPGPFTIYSISVR